MTTASETMTGELSERLADTRLRIGTRTTPLAKAQTQRVVGQLDQVVPGMPLDIVGIETSADLWTATCPCSAARATSPRRSTVRSSPAGSTSPCTHERRTR